MTNEELAKAISDIQNMLNSHNKTIEEINKNNELNQQTISDLIKTNNELMLSVSAPIPKEQEETEEEIVSKLLDDYSEHFDEESLKEFINIFEEGVLL